MLIIYFIFNGLFLCFGWCNVGGERYAIYTFLRGNKIDLFSEYKENNEKNFCYVRRIFLMKVKDYKSQIITAN
jgi:uncharacterized membrane-anchored protein YitT (DUF2179 family)